jgi:hypothetical protein
LIINKSFKTRGSSDTITKSLFFSPFKMHHDIKLLVEATEHEKLKKLLESHVKELTYEKESKHLVIYVDNATPLHELDDKEMNEPLRKCLEKVYDVDSTYEIRIFKDHQLSDRENAVPHNVS